MVIDIALGIVLAVVILAVLPSLVVLAASLLGLLIAVGAGIGVLAALFYAWNHMGLDELIAILGTALFIAVLVGATWLIERHTKMTGQEFFGLCLAVPGGLFVAYQIVQALTDTPRNLDALGPLCFGLVICFGLVAYIVASVSGRRTEK